jgi:ribosomal protein L11 methylase PrmA
MQYFQPLKIVKTLSVTFGTNKHKYTNASALGLLEIYELLSRQRTVIDVGGGAM